MGGDADVVREMKEGKATARPLRYTDDLVERFNFALDYFLDATKCLLKYYRPDELGQYEQWCMQVLQPRSIAINEEFGG